MDPKSGVVQRDSTGRIFATRVAKYDIWGCLPGSARIGADRAGSTCSRCLLAVSAGQRPVSALTPHANHGVAVRFPAPRPQTGLAKIMFAKQFVVAGYQRNGLYLQRKARTANRMTKSPTCVDASKRVYPQMGGVCCGGEVAAEGAVCNSGAGQASKATMRIMVRREGLSLIWKIKCGKEIQGCKEKAAFKLTMPHRQAKSSREGQRKQWTARTVLADQPAMPGAACRQHWPVFDRAADGSRSPSAMGPARSARPAPLRRVERHPWVLRSRAEYVNDGASHCVVLHTV